jgi:hypothetical protein
MNDVETLTTDIHLLIDELWDHSYEPESWERIHPQPPTVEAELRLSLSINTSAGHRFTPGVSTFDSLRVPSHVEGRVTLSP